MILACGPGDDEPDYTGINSPTGKCEKHGDYLYFCSGCQEECEATQSGDHDPLNEEERRAIYGQEHDQI